LSNENAAALVEDYYNRVNRLIVPLGLVRVRQKDKTTPWTSLLDPHETNANGYQIISTMKLFGYIDVETLQAGDSRSQPQDRDQAFDQYLVRLQDSGRKMASELTANTAVYHVGTATVTTLALNQLYKHPALREITEYRLLIGRFKLQPTAFGLEYLNAMGVRLESEFKFRALAKADLLNGRYVLDRADWGYVNDLKWRSQAVPE
jgi:hypothetical protein